HEFALADHACADKCLIASTILRHGDNVAFLKVDCQGGTYYGLGLLDQFGCFYDDSASDIEVIGQPYGLGNIGIGLFDGMAYDSGSGWIREYLSGLHSLSDSPMTLHIRDSAIVPGMAPRPDQS